MKVQPIIESKHHSFFVFDSEGTVFEVILRGDYWFANTQNAIDLDNGDRFGRFLCTGSWNSDMVQDYLRNRKYIIAK